MKLLYTVATPGTHATLDEMVEGAPPGLAGSHLVHGQACVLFRLDSDSDAVALALSVVGPDNWVIHTGYGIHRRLVAQAVPGCTCSELSEYVGCEACTCPQCGTQRRYGVSPEHPMMCRTLASLGSPTT